MSHKFLNNNIDDFLQNKSIEDIRQIPNNIRLRLLSDLSNKGYKKHLNIYNYLLDDLFENDRFRVFILVKNYSSVAEYILKRYKDYSQVILHYIYSLYTPDEYNLIAPLIAKIGITTNDVDFFIEKRMKELIKNKEITNAKFIKQGLILNEKYYDDSIAKYNRFREILNNAIKQRQIVEESLESTVTDDLTNIIIEYL